ncbi:unnamed protein product [Globisporangium polare]
MDSSSRYANPQAFSEYMENSGTEMLVTDLLHAGVSEAFDAWLERIWLVGDTRVNEVRNSRRLVGHVRHAPLSGPSNSPSCPWGDSDLKDQQIASICYKVVDVALQESASEVVALLVQHYIG